MRAWKVTGGAAVVALATAAVAVACSQVKPALSPHTGSTSPAPVTAPVPTTTVNPALAPAIPAHGAYTGAYVQPAAYTEPATVAAVQALQRRAGGRLDVVHSYLRWRVPFPGPGQQAILNQGSMLLLSWAGDDTRVIASGRDDRWIRRQARAIKAARRPIFLEWRWEMNRPGLAAQVHSPADYIAAWDHIRSIFTQQHVTNVAWVWCPTIAGFGALGWYRPASAFYPGNNEVDWLCADIYPTPGTYTSFATLAQPFLAWASHIDKPVMIGEYGAPRSYGSQTRVTWLRGAARVARSDTQIKALVYFDADPVHPGGRGPLYRLDPGSAPLQAFLTIADEPYFDPNRLRAPGRSG